MADRRLISWNVVSLRNMLEKASLAPPGQPHLSFLQWLETETPDILCLQETKIQADQIPPQLVSPPGYHSDWSFARRKGYSGVATFSRHKPVKVQEGLGVPEFDAEGRVLLTEYDNFSLFNIYFPKAYSPREVEVARKEGANNADKMAERLTFKLAFYDKVLEVLEKFHQQGKRVVVCGDFNIAHTEIDLARPKQNKFTSGFLPEERRKLDDLVSLGFTDSFRKYHPEAGHYTWWSYRFKAREKDIGWRLDYFFVSPLLAASVSSAAILKNVYGSDHCPVSLSLKTS